MIQTLLIGNMEQMEVLYKWLQCSNETFEINMVISENATSSEYFTCDIKPVSELSDIELQYDVIFICSSLFDRYREILSMLGVDLEKIKAVHQVKEYLPPKYYMEYCINDIKNTFWKSYQNYNNLEIGNFSYGTPRIMDYGEGSRLTIGKFCSFAEDVTIFLGGNHRDDWCTTYPFNCIMERFFDIQGHPASNGDIVIGNDVWIGMHTTIMSGVTLGDGCVVAANACVTKDVSPYTVVGGVPAKKIRNRFSESIKERFLKIRWWDWSNELIYDAIPLLQSNSFEELFAFYERYVK